MFLHWVTSGEYKWVTLAKRRCGNSKKAFSVAPPAIFHVRWASIWKNRSWFLDTMKGMPHPFQAPTAGLMLPDLLFDTVQLPAKFSAAIRSGSK
jgi:hypothetical protein